MKPIAMGLAIPAIALASGVVTDFSINGITIGSSKEQLLDRFPKVVREEIQPPQFGAIEEILEFDGATAHVTDGKVTSIKVNSPHYSTPSGIRPGISVAVAANVLKQYDLVSDRRPDVMRFALPDNDCSILLMVFDGQTVQGVELWCTP